MRSIYRFIIRHVVVEIVLLLLFIILIMLIFSVQSDGSLAEPANYLTNIVQKAFLSTNTNFDQSNISENTPSALPLVFESDITGYAKPFIISLNCGAFAVSSSYAKYSATIIYFVLVPFFFSIRFIYNNRSISDVSKIGRVTLSILLAGVLTLLTFQIIELQEISNLLVNSEYRNAEDIFEKYLYGCYPNHLDTKDADKFVSFSSVSISNVKTLLVEARLYILAIFLWVLGRSVQDMKNIKDNISDLQTDSEQ